MSIGFFFFFFWGGGGVGDGNYTHKHSISRYKLADLIGCPVRVPCHLRSFIFLFPILSFSRSPFRRFTFHFYFLFFFLTNISLLFPIVHSFVPSFIRYGGHSISRCCWRCCCCSPSSSAVSFPLCGRWRSPHFFGCPLVRRFGRCRLSARRRCRLCGGPASEGAAFSPGRWCAARLHSVRLAVHFVCRAAGLQCYGLGGGHGRGGKLVRREIGRAHV